MVQRAAAAINVRRMTDLEIGDQDFFRKLRDFGKCGTPASLTRELANGSPLRPAHDHCPCSSSDPLEEQRSYSRARVLRGVASKRLVSDAMTPGIKRMRLSTPSKSVRLTAPSSMTRSHLPLVV